MPHSTNSNNWKHSKALPDNLVILRYHYNKREIPISHPAAGHVSLEILYTPEEQGTTNKSYRYANRFCMNLYLNSKNKVFYHGILRISPEEYENFNRNYEELKIKINKAHAADDEVDYVMEEQKNESFSCWQRYYGWTNRKFVIGGLSLDGMLSKINIIFPQKFALDSASKTDLPAQEIDTLRENIKPFELYQNTHNYGCCIGDEGHVCSSLVNDVLAAGGFKRTHYFSCEPVVQHIIALFAGICLAVPFIRFVIEFGWDPDIDVLIDNTVKFITSDISVTTDVVRHAYILAITCLMGAIVSLLIRAIQSVTMGAEIYLGYKSFGAKLIRPSTIMRQAAAAASDEEGCGRKTNTLNSKPIRVKEVNNGADERNIIATTFMRDRSVKATQIELPKYYICPLDPLSITPFNKEKFLELDPKVIEFLESHPDALKLTSTQNGNELQTARTASAFRIPLLASSHDNYYSYKQAEVLPPATALEISSTDNTA